MASRRILLINGPNLNLLGKREPDIYGSVTLGDVETRARAQANDLGIELETFQSNHEGAIVDRIQQAAGWGPAASNAHHMKATSNGSADGGQDKQEADSKPKVSAIIINAGALTHTSVAVRDALLSVGIPFVEIHVSNVHAREPFRHHSYLADKATAVICGLGVYGYTAAIEFAANHLKV